MSPIYQHYEELAQYWMLIALVQLGAYKKIMNERRCDDDEALIALGIVSSIDDLGEWNFGNTRNALFALYEKFLSDPPAIPSKTTLAKNIAWLGKSIGLSQLEQDILHMRIIVSRHIELRGCLDYVSNALDLFGLVRMLSILMGSDESLIEEALRPNSGLFRSGILKLPNGLEGLTQKLEILGGLADRLQTDDSKGFGLFADCFVISKSPQLGPENYPHLQQDIDLLDGYLKDALEHRRCGVNILIHGAPGSGKTEFVRMLAAKVTHPLFEIATENQSGMPIERGSRFRAYQMSQHILASHAEKPLILFDEVEDVFKRGGEDDESENAAPNVSGIKAWINRLLEENPVPAFWLSNNIGCIDRAFLRRFDYVIELGAPPRSVRSQVVEQYLGDLSVNEHWKSKIAEYEQLNPAVLERAAKVVRRTKDIYPDTHGEQALERVLGNSLEALGLPRFDRTMPMQTIKYRVDVLNTDCDVNAACEGLRESGEGRLCLYGPPGTGKSALGKHLSDVLDKPLMIRRASDILSSYVGMTEKNMARMFRDAEADGAVLLLDEADSFLRDRTGASRSWEVTEVNEMLTQMEAFRGIFIASTNLMGALDAASLRRFDLKIRFNYLEPEQIWLMLEDISAQLGIEMDESIRSRACSLRNLTPGDFATVMRQSRLCKISDAGDLVERLSAECAAKPNGGSKGIGFLNP